MQKHTSKDTSVNKGKLPASTKHIDWEQYRGMKVLDYGGGKFNNLRDYLKENYDITLSIFDPYNRSYEDNIQAINCKPRFIICNNVLNVIDDTTEIEIIIQRLHEFNVTTVYYIYEGNRSGIGAVSKKDCWQRNETVTKYKPFFTGKDYKRKGRLITVIK